ncbi:hypothetical protein H8784_16800 [Parabacteroides acidifaciens]|uniref:Uncharacterized protein n=1 Tax=Parabacteroides acidifaciens TaxID=2290935 RepID=A0A3D8HA55_9BACT|nr:hypothetical protein [Parabacteroides acidifaciens]MBC8603374.1 hypothetical protein [Parabacteroides acidifaciens]RDU47876.1 hypothetical protein DWU89_17205 [Parabacteroides acidifaciens]
MLKRDFIMVQIEELAKVVLQIITNRNTNAARRIPELIQTVYTSLKLDRLTLMTVPPEELIRRLNSDDGGGIPRLEIAVKTLIEESYLHPGEEQDMLQRAKLLLEYIQTHDNTFSLERVSLLDELEQRLSK